MLRDFYEKFKEYKVRGANVHVALMVGFASSFSCNLYHPQRSWGKVIFSQAPVILSTGGCALLLWGTCVVAGGGMSGCWGVYMVARGHAWLQGAMRGCQGACVVAGGGHVWLLGVCMVAGRACVGAGGGHVWLPGGVWLLGGAWLRGACTVAGGHAWLLGACMVAGGGVCVVGGHAWLMGGCVWDTTRYGQ